MGQSHQPNLHLLYNEMRLADLFQVLDELHTAASDGQLQNITSLTSSEIVGWLNDLAFTAQETISEIRNGEGAANPASHLRLVK